MGSVALKLVAKKGKDKLVTKHDSLFQIKAEDIDGNMQDLGELCKNKKCIMVVNVASK